MRKLTKKEFPYVFMSVALALLCNQIIYQDTRLITRYFHHWDIATPLDHTFRLIPWTLIIYFGCFAFWGISYAIIALQDDRQKSEQFFSAVAVSKILVMIMFIVFPPQPTSGRRSRETHSGTSCTGTCTPLTRVTTISRQSTAWSAGSAT